MRQVSQVAGLAFPPSGCYLPPSCRPGVLGLAIPGFGNGRLAQRESTTLTS